MMFDLFLLFLAGIIGGIINSVAGGGSFITFPALLLAGVPAIAANATNTFSAFSGYMSGAFAFRHELKTCKGVLRILLISLCGGAIGAYLLLQTTAATFEAIVPWLLLFATLLFALGGRINLVLQQAISHSKGLSKLWAGFLICLLLLVCIYGGFFNAGLGIITLSYLALAGYHDINLMNGLKLLVSSAVSLTAIGLFIAGDLIYWREGIAVMLGTLIGGYVAAHVSRSLPQHYVRWFVLIASSAITAYFFVDTYLL